MKSAKRPHGLGRGLSALLGDVAREEPVAPTAAAPPSTKAIQSIEVALIQPRSEEHTSELQSLMRISYAVFCLKKKKYYKQKSKQTIMTSVLVHHISRNMS